MSPYIPQWEPRKNWVEYEDGSFEPVNSQENLGKKKRGDHAKVRPDWWMVNQPPDWRPEKYADTKRGKKAERELGFAETPKKEQRADAWEQEPQNKEYKQPQHENTGKAMAKLGGEDDGKITLLDDDLAPIGQNRKTRHSKQPNSTQDAARMRRSLLSSQLREYNARTDEDHRTGHEKRKGLGKVRQPAQRTDAQREADCREARQWITEHGQKYAKEEMLDVADNATQWSKLRQDIEYVANADTSKMSKQEREALNRKKLQLSDVLISSPFFDATAFVTTMHDINASDVSTWRKAGAHVANGVGLAGGVLPSPGSQVLDAAVYEGIDQLLSEEVPEKPQFRMKRKGLGR